uniref:1,4-alpha-glucan branching enzyme n=1 Tax=Klebsiella phage PMBT63 TaxID=3229739 RepID=A0AB39C1Z6_9CAUD
MYFSKMEDDKMAKHAKAKTAVKEVVGTSKRAGYKRGSNKRINQTVEKIMRRARAVLRDDASRFGKPKA